MHAVTRDGYVFCCREDVEAKKLVLAGAEAKLAKVDAALQIQLDTQAGVEGKIATLKAQVREAQDESQRLPDEAGLTQALGRAGK